MNNNCPKCGTLKEQDDLFCSECGFKFETTEVKETSIEDNNSPDLLSDYQENDLEHDFCKHCHNREHKIESFCNNCSYTKKEEKNEIQNIQSKKECPNCHSYCDEDSDFCNKCGTNLKQKNICSSCGQEYAEEDLFCKKCGNKLQKQQTNIIVQENQKDNYCKICGEEVTPLDAFCRNCGYDLINDKKPNTHQPKIIKKEYVQPEQEEQTYTSYTRKCPYCGSILNGRNQKKCPHCGEWLEVSHFGCGAGLLILFIIISIFMGLAGSGTELPFIGYIGGGTLFVIAFIYLVPSLIAEARGHESKVAIFIINLLLGWTFLGWVIPLIWACTGRSR